MAEEGEGTVIEGEGTTVVEPSPEELAEARSMGWVPKEQWRGEGGAQWLDAKSFLERGRTLMPVISANNRKLKEEIATRDGRLAELERKTRAQEAALAAIEAEQAEDAIATHVATREEIKAEIARASREGDHDALAEATIRLHELGEPPAKKTAAENAASGTRIPEALGREVLGWFEQNPEYKVGTPKEMLARSISDQMRAAGDTRSGAVFLDDVKTRTEQYIAEHFGGSAPGASRVSSGNGGTGRSAAVSGMSKSYADLPAEAKAYCDKFEKRLVGADKRFKTREAWHKSYVSQYFGNEQGA